MRTIDVRTNKYTEVVVLDEPEFGANHEYKIKPINGDQNPPLSHISFQKGPTKEYGVNGCHEEDLLTIVLDRLYSFQKTDFNCRENDFAIVSVENALHWLNARTMSRRISGIEGTSKK